MLHYLAAAASSTKIRLYPESSCLYRDEFQRDKDRIIQSNSFRRLEYKTQVFINHEGDHYRNRLTHSLEVASIGRTIAKYLGLSEDLTEAISLAHDLGHTPFGHAGEEALNYAMTPYGGFSHNLHTFKILVELEQRYAEYNGLNLTRGVLDGVLKHNGPVIGDVGEVILEYNHKLNLDLKCFSSLEGQISALADDIAYLTHDLEDVIRSKLLHIDDLRCVPKLNDYINNLYIQYPQIDDARLIWEVKRRVAKMLIHDLISNVISNVKALNLKSSEDVCNLEYSIVRFSDETNIFVRQMREFFRSKVYKHESIYAVFAKARHVLIKLFEAYKTNNRILSNKWYNMVVNAKDDKAVAVVIANYIAGMTDRYAIAEFERIYNINFNEIEI